MGSIAPPPEEFPQIVLAAWQALGRAASVVRLDEISANVSTNRVYRVTLDDGHEVIAKTSTYGSYIHFRQDHQLIDRWNQLLQASRFASFLSPVLVKGDSVFTYRQDNAWAVFYGKAPFYDFLPRVLDDPMIDSLGRELAQFHEASASAARLMNPSWKSLGSDIASLYDVLGNDQWLQERRFDAQMGYFLRGQCDTLLENAERLNYYRFQKIPILVDWNIGNFSIGLDGTGFKLYSRWDYDWFRIESRVLDFYFCSRVVRSEGDQTVFTYSAEPLFEGRFRRFLRTYHQHSPLSQNEVLFLKEAYRFFLLNYVVRSGEHFFRPSYCGRLQNEVVEQYLPKLDALDFSVLLDCLD